MITQAINYSDKSYHRITQAINYLPLYRGSA
jgi:hypothetical protein